MLVIDNRLITSHEIQLSIDYQIKVSKLENIFKDVDSENEYLEIVPEHAKV